MSREFIKVLLVVVCGCLTVAIPRTEQGELRLFAPAFYDVETTVLLNDVTRKDKEVGYKIMGTLEVVPVWSQEHTEFLLSFRLLTPKLHLRGKYVNADFLPHISVWDSFSDSTFYAHWKNGLIEEVYVDPEEILDVVNYKKSLASLFQFQVLDGEYNETDASGPCMVLYETLSVNVFRKIKRSCIEDAGGSVIEARRISRYTLTPKLDALEAVYADELVKLGDASLGIKARAWTRLALREEVPAIPTRAMSLTIAIESLPTSLKPQSLTLASTQIPGEKLDDKELISLLETIGQSDDIESAAGNTEGAEALLRLLPAIRLSSATRLTALLELPDVHPHLSVLCRVLGLAGTRAAYSAVSDVVQLGSEEPVLYLAAEYLAAFALALEPEDSVVLDVLKLGEEARTEAVADSALLAAAAAAGRRAPSSGDSPSPSLALRDSLVRSLSRCKDDQCRIIRLQALGNLRREDTTDLLLDHALNSAINGSSDISLSAIEALSVLPTKALTYARLNRLTDLSVDERASLEVRASAIDLVMQRRTMEPTPLGRVAYLLHERGPHELRRVFWQRLMVLAKEHEEIKRLPSMLLPVMRGWDAQAHSGTSTVLVRETGWDGAGWKGILESVQLSNAGMLRRGATSLRAIDGTGNIFDALTVRVWTRGLESFGSGDSNDGEESAAAEEMAGGLALSVGGARMRDIALFNGQGELLGHVWAGTASSPTPALRALLPLTSQQKSIPLHTGVRIYAHNSAVIQLALDASAHVSIWYRTARAELSLKAAAATFYSATLHTAWGSVTANVTATAAPRLRIGVDTDFYSKVAVCVRSRTDEHLRTRRVTLQSEQGFRKHFVRRSRSEQFKIAGRTLSLGRINDDTCRTLRSGDEDDV